jgi:hypothetical protein
MASIKVAVHLEKILPEGLKPTCILLGLRTG